MKILLIEDNEDHAVMTKRFLNSTCPDYQLHHVAAIDDGLNELTQNEYHVVICDYRLPQGTASDVLTGMKKKGIHIPLVVVTSTGDQKIAVQLMKEGAYDYVVKDQSYIEVLPLVIARSLERFLIQREKDLLGEEVFSQKLFLENIINSLGYPLYVVNQDFTIALLNNTALAQLRYSGEHCYEVLYHRAAPCQCDYPCVLQEVLRTHETISFEYSQVLSDGTMGYFEVYGVPIANKDGSVRQIIEYHVDITSSKRYEESLNRLASIVEHSDDAIVGVTLKGAIETWNRGATRMLGFSELQMTGKPVESIVPLNMRDDVNLLCERVKQGGAVENFETLFMRKGEEAFHVSVAASPVVDAHEKIRGVAFIIRDITERVQAERKLKESMETKARFTSMVSHELRTPLTAMRESISVVLDELTGPLNVEQKDFLLTAQRNVDRLARLINDVLDFQKLEAGRMAFSLQENDISSVVNEVYSFMRPQVDEKKLDFQLRLADNLPRLTFDKDRITQVLANLVSNAAKFTERGSITIGARQDKDMVVVSVTDTGKGIKPEDMGRLFQSFEQLGSMQDRKAGTGLGLAISKEIIEHHKGGIWVESEWGKGATFSFSLPLLNGKQ